MMTHGITGLERVKVSDCGEKKCGFCRNTLYFNTATTFGNWRFAKQQNMDVK